MFCRREASASDVLMHPSLPNDSKVSYLICSSTAQFELIMDDTKVHDISTIGTCLRSVLSLSHECCG